MVNLVDPVTSIRRLLYLVSPNETSYQTAAEVPDYVSEAIPYYAILIILEYIISIIKNQRKARVSDGIASMSAGIYSQVVKLFTRSADFAGVWWVHKNFCIYELPWDSPWTWIATMIGIDFAYYWLHRGAHEINFMWTGHQVHHSSEDYNLTTALRQSAFHTYFSFFFYMPLGLFLPPAMVLVHLQFNLMYQFWIHTEVIKTLGPLEWIINTPSHHRVHHGRNPYCIDKNYGGTLIIWDRMFNTFAAEKEQVVYGLVHPLETYDAHKIQLSSAKYVFDMFLQRKGWRNKLYTLICGPGWEPGTGWHGDPNGLPEVESPEIVYNPYSSFWTKSYCIFHFILSLILYIYLMMNQRTLSPLSFSLGALILLWGLTSYGNLLDIKTHGYGTVLEMGRCLVCICAGVVTLPSAIGLHAIFLFSLIFVVVSFSIKEAKKQVKHGEYKSDTSKNK